MKPIKIVAGAFVWMGVALSGRTEPIPLKHADDIAFVIRDGTVRGKVDLKVFEVETAYGKLNVPASDIIRIRIGKNSDKDLKGRIDKRILDLANKDFRIREEAQKELIKLGKQAYPELEAASHSIDTEVKERAATILAGIQFEDEEEPLAIDDEILTSTFTIRGTLKFDALSVTTKYGPLRLEKKDILSMTLAEPEYAYKTFSLLGKNTVQSQWLDTGIRVRKGDRLLVSASGAIQWPNFSNTTEPCGNENWGTWRTNGAQNFYIGALVGKIGTGGAFLFLGEKYNEKVNSEGTLLLAIGTNWGGTQNSTGEYKVKIEVRPSSGSTSEISPKTTAGVPSPLP